MSRCIFDINNHIETYEFEKVARQADGAAWLKVGDTVLLATIAVDRDEVIEGDFLPLTVQYLEKSYAAGKMPGGFFKRESKPSDFETLTSRLVDRSLRPLFPKGFAHPTQITIMVLSVDKEADLQRLALNAASAAMLHSNLSFKTSVTGVRLGKIDGKIEINPTNSQMQESTLDLFVAGSKDDLLMIEMRSLGSIESEMIPMPMVDPMIDPTLASEMITTVASNAMPEDELIEVISIAQEALNVANVQYEEAFIPLSRAEEPVRLLEEISNSEIYAHVQEVYKTQIEAAISQMAKSERNNSLKTISKAILASDIAKENAWHYDQIKSSVVNYKRKCVRDQIIEKSVRADGRTLTQVRPISIETNVLPNAHASCLFTRGQTQALVVLTVGGNKDAQMFENLTDAGTQNEAFMLHYNFPGFSVGEASPVGAPKRRELGHGNLGKRALEAALDAQGRTIRLVSEILESNGSSSMATVCGGYMALRAAEIEMSDPIAGIAMGLVIEGDKHAVLSDIMGLEDHDGDMDFKVAGSYKGITAMQMDIKLGGISKALLHEALLQAKEGRVHILDIMKEAEENITINEEKLPSMDLFSIDPSRIAEVIGQAGKTIREIIEKFEVSIDIDKKEGNVRVSGSSKKGVKSAREHIESLLSAPKEKAPEYQVGDIVMGKVKRTVDFGAFIELPGGIDGLLHISKISKERVSKVEDVLSVGQEIEVEILEFKGNKISLGRP
ncbi:MAG: polyribonucleotide nucleotidyltransferase [Campylobacterales bacterium]|nr:polyribonucleotide nucleotidyltransferase [Campylobacterales bacterium]